MKHGLHKGQHLCFLQDIAKGKSERAQILKPCYMNFIQMLFVHACGSPLGAAKAPKTTLKWRLEHEKATCRRLSRSLLISCLVWETKVVFTSALSLAPFLWRSQIRPRSSDLSGQNVASKLHSSVDVAMVHSRRDLVVSNCGLLTSPQCSQTGPPKGASIVNIDALLCQTTMCHARIQHQ
eukprot:5010331-Amphidinium_carterae.2